MGHDCEPRKLYEVHAPRAFVEGAFIGKLLRYEVNADINGDHEIVLVLQSDARCVAELVQCVLDANEPCLEPDNE